MKTIAQIIGGAQGLLDISFELQDKFEEHLTDEYKTFLQVLRVAEEHAVGLARIYAGTGRRPYSYPLLIQTNAVMKTVLRLTRQNRSGIKYAQLLNVQIHI